MQHFYFSDSEMPGVRVYPQKHGTILAVTRTTLPTGYHGNMNVGSENLRTAKKSNKDGMKV